MIAVGVDSGSTVTKLAVLQNGRLIRVDSLPSGTNPAGTGQKLLEAAQQAIEVVEEWKICATGYGRKLLASLGNQKTEISCHAKGAYALQNQRVHWEPELVPGAPTDLRSIPEGFTLLDIGGQDSKVIRVDATGKSADFAMNDKCAAGTGRFLEVIGRTLGFGITGLSAAALSSDRKLKLSSVCTVFADAEAVSLTARGEKPEEIAWAACFAVAERCAGLVKRIGAQKHLVFTGGVSDLPAVAEALKTLLAVEILIPPLARFSGAVGAALYAQMPSP